MSRSRLLQKPSLTVPPQVVRRRPAKRQPARTRRALLSVDDATSLRLQLDQLSSGGWHLAGLTVQPADLNAWSIYLVATGRDPKSGKDDPTSPVADASARRAGCSVLVDMTLRRT
jgi:hypothetical protein